MKGSNVRQTVPFQHRSIVASIPYANTSQYTEFGIVNQVSVNDEGRDMWKVYLDLKDYAAALANCRDPLQRDQVYLAQVMAY